MNYKHGHAVGGLSPTYRTWQRMLDRCTNPANAQYPDYGEAGIAVCAKWRTFAGFLADMGERPSGTTLDRYPNNKGSYEPGNCRWATPKQQSRNLCTNRLIEFQGRSMILTDWAAFVGMSSGLLHARIYRLGWSVQRAITTAVDTRKGPRIRLQRGKGVQR